MYRNLLVVLFLALLLAGPQAAASPQEGEPDYGDHLAPLPARAIELHGLWLAFLRGEAQADASRLAELLAMRRPLHFEAACESPIQNGDFERLRAAIATVLMSGLSASPDSVVEPGGRGRYLACLRSSGGGNLATRVELAVQNGWLSTFQAARPMRCHWQPQGDNPAYVNHATGQITWQSPSSFVEGRLGGAPGLRAAQTFANIWFHESLHVAGIRGHRLVDPAVACCGDVVEDRAAGCAALDAVLRLESDTMQLAGPLGRTSVLGPAESLFAARDLTSLAMDLYARLSEQLRGLVAPDQRASCVSAEGRAACTRRVLAGTRAAVDETLGPRCVELVGGGGEAACGRVDAALRAQVAADAARRLMPAP